MLGIMRSRPCEAVKVVVGEPSWSAPWTAPAATASLPSIVTLGLAIVSSIVLAESHSLLNVLIVARRGESFRSRMRSWRHMLRNRSKRGAAPLALVWAGGHNR